MGFRPRFVAYPNDLPAAVRVTLAACVGLALAPSAAGASDRPVLLLFHSGGFFLDSGPMPIPEREAARMGFRPRFVAYPNDLPAAVRAAPTPPGARAATGTRSMPTASRPAG